MKAGEIENLVALGLVRLGNVQAEALENLRGEWLEASAGEILIVEKPKGDFSLIGGLAPLKRWLRSGKRSCNTRRRRGRRDCTPPKGVC